MEQSKEPFSEQLCSLALDLGAKADMWSKDSQTMAGYLEEASDALAAAADYARGLGA